MKICITGATGFIGAHLVRHFHRKGHEVIAIGRQQKPPKTLLKYAKWIKADISKPFATISCDVCIHSAALASDKGKVEAFHKANIEGTKNVFEAIKAPVFIHISSASVYPLLIKRLEEQDAVLEKCTSIYGKSKLESELFLKSKATNKKSITVLRPRAVYGTHDRVLLPRILDLVKGGRLILPGDCNVEVSMTNILNLITAVEQAIKMHLKGFNTFNITDERTYNLREVIEALVFGIYGKKLPVWELPIQTLQSIASFCERYALPFKVSTQSLNYMSHSTVLDLQKSKDLLKYKARTDFFHQLPYLKKWVQQLGMNFLKKKTADIPWHLSSKEQHFQSLDATTFVIKQAAKTNLPPMPKTG